MRLLKRFLLRGVEFPVYAATLPKSLVGFENGKIPDSMLTVWRDAHGRSCRMSPIFLEPWIALVWLAKVTHGVDLTFTSSADVYRDYGQQERGFLKRNTTTFLPFRPRRMWNGAWWYLKPGNAGIAVPGTSNHGWAGQAVDHCLMDDKGRASRPTWWLKWLVDIAVQCGYSWEAPSEDWHIRYCLGDERTPLVSKIHWATEQAPQLKIGSTGNQVKLWQKIIGTTVDGDFGPVTEAKLREWQSKQTAWYGGKGLPVTGVVDGDDWWAAS